MQLSRNYYNLPIETKIIGNQIRIRLKPKRIGTKPNGTENNWNWKQLETKPFGIKTDCHWNQIILHYITVISNATYT